MAQERTSMRKIREVLRLHFEALISNAKIASVAKISRTIYNEIYGCGIKLAVRLA